MIIVENSIQLKWVNVYVPDFLSDCQEFCDYYEIIQHLPLSAPRSADSLDNRHCREYNQPTVAIETKQINKASGLHNEINVSRHTQLNCISKTRP